VVLCSFGYGFQIVVKVQEQFISQRDDIWNSMTYQVSLGLSGAMGNFCNILVSVGLQRYKYEYYVIP